MKSLPLTIQMKGTEQYFPVVVCTMLYKVVLPFESVDETIQKLLSSTFLWCCLLCCIRWFYLLSLWMKSSSVTYSNESY